MEISLKKLLPFVGAMCISAASLYADGTPCCDESCPPTTTHINACACPRPADDCGGFIGASYILWAPRQTGMIVALDGVPQSSSTGSITRECVHYPHFRLQSGFKVEAGINFEHDCWDVLAEYTWIRQNESSFNGPTDQAVGSQTRTATFLPTPATGVSGLTASDPIVGVQSRWQFKFNAVDLELARAYYHGHYTTIRPFLGFKGSWQDQNLDIIYGLDDATPQLTSTTEMKQKYWGVGIRAGFDSEFLVCGDWGIFATLAASELWSKFEVTQVGRNVEGSVVEYLTNVCSDHHQLIPVLELMLGIRWDTCWDDNCWHFRFEAGWEEQVWWDMNHFLTFNGYVTGNGGAFTMQGLTIKLRFDF